MAWILFTAALIVWAIALLSSLIQPDKPRTSLKILLAALFLNLTGWLAMLVG